MLHCYIPRLDSSIGRDLRLEELKTMFLERDYPEQIINTAIKNYNETIVIL